MSATEVAPSRQIIALQTSLEDSAGLAFPDSATLQVRLQEEAARLGEGTVWLIAWLDYVVLVGLVTANHLHVRQAIDPLYLQELRLFSPYGEWRLQRDGEAFRARCRCDGTGAPGEALDDDQSLWGTQTEAIGEGWTALIEGRGIRYDMPWELHAADLPLRLRVRNYLASDASGMVGVTDRRLVAIVDQRDDPLVREGKAHA